MFTQKLVTLSTLVLAEARARKLKIATAESCTGGLVAALLTDVPGSSDVFERGFVTYSNLAKRELLGVSGDMIADYGAVSEPVARAMAEGALTFSRADLSVSITGVAGPDGGTALKPVGHVHLASARRGRNILHELHEFGPLSRVDVRLAAVEAALNLLQRHL